MRSIIPQRLACSAELSGTNTSNLMRECSAPDRQSGNSCGADFAFLFLEKTK